MDISDPAAPTQIANTECAANDLSDLCRTMNIDATGITTSISKQPKIFKVIPWGINSIPFNDAII